MWNPQRNLTSDVAEGVAALIAVRGGVRQLAAADAIEHDQDDAWKGSQVSDVSIVAMACLNARRSLPSTSKTTTNLSKFLIRASK
jgi:hypothetical protein